MASSLEKPVSDKDAGGTCVLHASCVEKDGRAALLLGPSGSGKSELALQMMALGARLVSDDQTCIYKQSETLWSHAPAAIKGMIEARGVGLLAAEVADRARLALIVDMAQLENERLPPFRVQNLLGVPVPLLHKVESSAFPAAILQYLKGGRCA